MDFLHSLLQGMSLIPAVVSSIEGLFGREAGQQKKESAMAFLLAAMQFPKATARREIVDGEKFRAGLSKAIDGVVECFNASCWGRGGR
jgi:hypothetical protein